MTKNDLYIRVLDGGGVTTAAGATTSTGLVRAVLAVLVSHARKPVHIDQMCRTLWDNGDRPASAEPNVRGYISQIRQMMGDHDARLVTLHRDGAYRLDVMDAQTDLGRFAQLNRAAARAIREGQILTGLGVYGEAFSMWNGVTPPYLSRSQGCSDMADGWSTMYDTALSAFDEAATKALQPDLVADKVASRRRHLQLSRSRPMTAA